MRRHRFDHAFTPKTNLICISALLVRIQISYLVSDRKPPLLHKICDEPPHFVRGFGHATGRTDTTEGDSASYRSEFPTSGHRLPFPSPCAGALGGELRRRWPRSGSAASSTSFGLTHALSHKQADAVQVSGQYRQCNSVRKSIGAVGANPTETTMLEVVDCRLDRRVLASCLGECLRFLALALGHRKSTRMLHKSLVRELAHPFNVGLFECIGACVFASHG